MFFLLLLSLLLDLFISNSSKLFIVICNCRFSVVVESDSEITHGASALFSVRIIVYGVCESLNKSSVIFKHKFEGLAEFESAYIVCVEYIYVVFHKFKISSNTVTLTTIKIPIFLLFGCLGIILYLHLKIYIRSDLADSSTNLSDADIDKAVNEAKQYEAEDKKRKEAVDNYNKLDGLIFTIEKSVKDLGDKLTDEDKSKLEEEVKLAKAELESKDNDRIVAATEKLSNESQAIFAKVYQQANPNGDMGGANGGDTEFHQ